MGFGIIKMVKVAGSLAGIQSHIYREHPSKTNPDIDESRTHLNFSMTDYPNEPFQSLEERFRARLEDLPGQKTKTGKTRRIQRNAVKLCEFVVTASPEEMDNMTPDDQNHYFWQSLEFLEARYGKENVIYAQVHLDESTPHMHVGVVPVLENRKLCAKELFTKKELEGLQEAFFADISQKYGWEKPRKGNKGLGTLRFKAEQAQKIASKGAFFEAAPARVRNYMQHAIQDCIAYDAERGDRAAQAALKYIKDYGDESWKNDWLYLTELEKEEKKHKASMRDDY